MFYALSMVLLRARATVDPIPLTVLVLHIAAMLILAIPAWWVWQTPTMTDALTFGAIGVLGVGGHLLLANAFARSQAGRLAALEYTALLWAAGLGYLFFAEVPGIATVVGALFIVGECVDGEQGVARLGMTVAGRGGLRPPSCNIIKPLRCMRATASRACQYTAVQTHAASLAPLAPSTIAVTPIPPAVQTEISARPPFSETSLDASPRMRAPVAAKGCP